MSRKLRIGGLIGLTLLLAAIGTFGLNKTQPVSADVVSSGVWLIPNHSIPPSASGTVNNAQWNCANAGGIQILKADQWLAQLTTSSILGFPTSGFNATTGIITSLFGTGIVVKPPQPLGAITFAVDSILSRPTVEIGPGQSIFICVNPTATTFPLPVAAGVNVQGCGSAPDAVLSTTIVATGACTGDGDGDLTFDARNIGGFSQPSCDNRTADAVVGDWSSDACFGPNFDANDAFLQIPDITNDLTTVIVTYTCTRNPNFGGIAFPLTVQQDRGSVAFNVICIGTASASSVSISLSPSTLEIVPARSNTSNSLIQVTVLDSLGNPVPNVEVEIQTNRCAVSAGNSLTTAALTSLPLGVGFDNDTRATAAVLIAALNTANPASFAAWELFALFHFPTSAGVTGATRTISTTQNASFSLATGLPTSSIAAAILGCSPTEAPAATPGAGTVTAIVPVIGGPDIIVTKDFTVIGPPASITVSASPTSLRCGEKSTITATVKDTAGQNVSDHTRVEMVTNLGGVLAGTGAVAAGAGPVVPISSTVAETFGGVATAFLLSSDAQEGPSEVVVTSGGTTATDNFGILDLNQVQSLTGIAGLLPTQGTTSFPTGLLASHGAFFPTVDLSAAATTVLGGVFSTPPVSAQTTVSCAIPGAALPIVAAPSISAPRTGQGLSISPPNTGDAGLAGTSGASWSLFAIGGIALSLVGLATLKFARR